MVFDIKMEDFIQKARLVAGGHMTKSPATITYASIVSRETVRIAMMVATLKAPVTEKVLTTLGLEFGKDAKRAAVIIKNLYDLKSAGAAFQSHLARCMESFGYQSCKADPGLWLKPENRPEDGAKYYSYLLCYVNDIL